MYSRSGPASGGGDHFNGRFGGDVLQCLGRRVRERQGAGSAKQNDAVKFMCSQGSQDGAPLFLTRDGCLRVWVVETRET